MVRCLQVDVKEALHKVAYAANTQLLCSGICEVHEELSECGLRNFVPTSVS